MKLTPNVRFLKEDPPVRRYRDPSVVASPSERQAAGRREIQRDYQDDATERQAADVPTPPTDQERRERRNRDSDTYQSPFSNQDLRSAIKSGQEKRTKEGKPGVLKNAVNRRIQELKDRQTEKVEHPEHLLMGVRNKGRTLNQDYKSDESASPELLKRQRKDLNKVDSDQRSPTLEIFDQAAQMDATHHEYGKELIEAYKNGEIKDPSHFLMAIGMNHRPLGGMGVGELKEREKPIKAPYQTDEIHQRNLNEWHLHKLTRAMFKDIVNPGIDDQIPLLEELEKIGGSLRNVHEIFYDSQRPFVNRTPAKDRQYGWRGEEDRNNAIKDDELLGNLLENPRLFDPDSGSILRNDPKQLEEWRSFFEDKVEKLLNPTNKRQVEDLLTALKVLQSKTGDLERHDELIDQLTEAGYEFGEEKEYHNRPNGLEKSQIYEHYGRMGGNKLTHEELLKAISEYKFIPEKEIIGALESRVSSLAPGATLEGEGPDILERLKEDGKYEELKGKLPPHLKNRVERKKAIENFAEANGSEGLEKYGMYNAKDNNLFDSNPGLFAKAMGERDDGLDNFNQQRFIEAIDFLELAMGMENPSLKGLKYNIDEVLDFESEENDSDRDYEGLAAEFSIGSGSEYNPRYVTWHNNLNLGNMPEDKEELKDAMFNEKGANKLILWNRYAEAMKRKGKDVNLDNFSQKEFKDWAENNFIPFEALALWRNGVLPDMNDGDVFHNEPASGGRGGNARARIYELAGFGEPNSNNNQYGQLVNGKMRPLDPGDHEFDEDDNWEENYEEVYSNSVAELHPDHYPEMGGFDRDYMRDWGWNNLDAGSYDSDDSTDYIGEDIYERARDSFFNSDSDIEDHETWEGMFDNGYPFGYSHGDLFEKFSEAMDESEEEFPFAKQFLEDNQELFQGKNVTDGDNLIEKIFKEFIHNTSPDEIGAPNREVAEADSDQRQEFFKHFYDAGDTTMGGESQAMQAIMKEFDFNQSTLREILDNNPNSSDIDAGDLASQLFNSEYISNYSLFDDDIDSGDYSPASEVLNHFADGEETGLDARIDDAISHWMEHSLDMDGLLQSGGMRDKMNEFLLRDEDIQDAIFGEKLSDLSMMERMDLLFNNRDGFFDRLRGPERQLNLFDN